MTGASSLVAPPPAAPVIPADQWLHGRLRTDPYAWLQERRSPAVLRHIAAENAYADSVLSSLRVPPAFIAAEAASRLPRSASQVPVPHGDYLYYLEAPEGSAGLLHCRQHRTSGKVEVMLDEAELARRIPGASVAAVAVSPDHRRLLFSVDGCGNERHAIHLKELESGRLFPALAAGAAADVAWGDDRTLYHIELDAANRPWRLYRHRLGGEGSELLYEETDPAFHLSLRRSESGAWLFLASSSLEVTEIRAFPAGAGGTPILLVPREGGGRAYVTHWRGAFVILTDMGGSAFRLYTAPEAAPWLTSWRRLLPDRSAVELRHVQAFRDHLVIHERIEGVPQIAVLAAEGALHRIDFPDAVRVLHLGDNREFDGAILRFGYDSPATPYRVYDYDLDRRSLNLLHQDRIVGFRPSDYKVERLHAVSEDGTRIPVTLVGRRVGAGLAERPVVLAVYGSYGASLEPEFSPLRVSLLDRGISFAFAHVRGGGELGPDWHKAGQRRRKGKSVADLIACAEHLAGLGFRRIGLMGQSAGGLLAAAAVNERPGLFAALVADVPFADPIGTLADDSLPFTAMDRGEWGDPRDEQDYAVLSGLAPYDNVRAAAYPPTLITAGWHDPRVGYWEPAKLAARLRSSTTGEAEILLRVRMEDGHSTAGRDGELMEWAVIHAFLLDRLGGA